MMLRMCVVEIKVCTSDTKPHYVTKYIWGINVWYYNRSTTKHPLCFRDVETEEEKAKEKNTTELLNRLIKTIDPRVRPGINGVYNYTFHHSQTETVKQKLLQIALKTTMYKQILNFSSDSLLEDVRNINNAFWVIFVWYCVVKQA